MCKNAQGTAATLMAAIEPTLKSLLALAGVDPTNFITQYDLALQAIQNWKSGTSAEVALEAIAAFQTAFNALPLPDTYKILANIILAGVETVIGVLSANSPVPNAPQAGDPVAGDADAAPDEVITAHYQAGVAVTTTAKVTALVPGFKRSIWHSPESQYKDAWNKAVEAGAFPDSLKAA